MTLYDTRLHRIYIVPIDAALLSIVGISSITSGYSSFKDFLKAPFIHVRDIRTSQSARNADLNPIGMKRNPRQNFGANSNKIVIDGYITPLKPNNEFVNSDYSILSSLLSSTSIKLAVLKYATLNQSKFMIIHNNDFEVVTFDEFSYTENANAPYIFDISINATSIRRYDGFKDSLKSLMSDITINTIAQNILPTLTF